MKTVTEPKVSKEVDPEKQKRLREEVGVYRHEKQKKEKILVEMLKSLKNLKKEIKSVEKDKADFNMIDAKSKSQNNSKIY